MTTTASTTGLRRGLRTLIQTVAGGGLTALVTLAAGSLPVAVSGLLVAIFGAMVALAQNWLESAGRVPVLLPTPAPVVTDLGGIAVATVEAAATTAGEVIGKVVTTTGNVVGAVTGHIDPEEEEEHA